MGQPQPIFDAIRKWRHEQAARRNVPPYQVLPDAAAWHLAAVAANSPAADQLLSDFLRGQRQAGRQLLRLLRGNLDRFSQAVKES